MRTATLGDIPLGAFSNALLPGTVDDDRGVDLGAVVAVGGDRLLVEERTDKAARLQSVRLDRDANILGGPWDATRRLRRWSSSTTRRPRVFRCSPSGWSSTWGRSPGCPGRSRASRAWTTTRSP
jgi:hypothetical protein